MEQKCVSCNRKIANDSASSSFLCPNCGDKRILRCSNCRKRSVGYKCSCGHEGP